MFYCIKIDNIKLNNYRFIIGDFLYPKLVTKSFITIRKGCKYCSEPHPCISKGYCPIDGFGGGVNSIYSISQIVEKLKEQGVIVSESLIKHYDKKGLITPIKTAGGHRRFDEDSLKEIAFIKKVQKYGYNLSEVENFRDIITNRDIEDIEDIFGPIKFYEEDFLIEKMIPNYSTTGDSSLYWWSDFGSGPGLVEKAEKRAIKKIVWGYVYKNIEYDRKKDILKYRMYLFPEKTNDEELKIKKLLDFIHLYILDLNSIDLDMEDIRDGTLDRFSLWVDDRITGYNKIIKARIHIFTDLKPELFGYPKDFYGDSVSIYYDFKISDNEKKRYEDYFIPDNYDQRKDGMYRDFL